MCPGASSHWTGGPEPTTPRRVEQAATHQRGRQQERPFGGHRLRLGLLLSLGAGTPLVSAADPTYLGAERCGQCHEAEYRQWRSTPHAEALARLSEKQQQDPVCRSCHTMLSAPPAEAADPRAARLSGVQCESCHGAGRYYAPAYVMRDAPLAKMMGLKGISEKTCASCHQPDGPNLKPFDYAEAVKKVRHRTERGTP